jgi:hypothetical protein
MLKLSITDLASLPITLSNLADPQVQVWRDANGELCAYGHIDSGLHWLHLPGLASFSFRQGTDKVQAFVHPSARQNLIDEAYRRIVLPLALQALGTEVLHASAVLTPHGLLALCAASGIGKSTLAFGLSRRGYPLWADDAVAFEVSGREVRTVPLPFVTRLRPDAAAFFAATATGASSAGVYPEQGRRGLSTTTHHDHDRRPLIALLVLKRRTEKSEDRTVQMTRLSPTQAFPAVLAHAYCFSLQNGDRKRHMTQCYLDLICRVPVYEVLFQSGLEKLPVILGEIEQSVMRL